jgi:hypothetical protein
MNEQIARGREAALSILKPSDDAIRQIIGGNVLRVARAVLPDLRAGAPS